MTRENVKIARIGNPEKIEPWYQEKPSRVTDIS